MKILIRFDDGDEHSIEVLTGTDWFPTDTPEYRIIKGFSAALMQTVIDSVMPSRHKRQALKDIEAAENSAIRGLFAEPKIHKDSVLR